VIGVVDWGIGGMWALGRLLSREPRVDVVYVSDQGNTPYGLQSRRELGRSVGRLVARARQAGATEVLVACHSASTVLADLPDDAGLHGVIAPSSVPADARRVLVLGGARTVRSGRWRRALGDREVVQRIAQPLSAAVEAGEADAPATRELVRRILAPVGEVDAIVLACTHYAALMRVIAELRPGIRVVDPAAAVAAELGLPPGTGRRVAWTTGDPGAIGRVLVRTHPELANELRFQEVR